MRHRECAGPVRQAHMSFHFLSPPPPTSCCHASLSPPCLRLYDTVVHPESGEEPEETSCQKLPAAILAAWKRLAASSPSPSQQQPQQPQQLQQQQQQPEGPAACSTDVTPQTPTTASEGAADSAAADGAGGAAAPAGASAASSEQQQQQQQQQQPQQPQQQQPQQVQAQEAPLPPTELLHLQHSAFSAPYCTWRPVAPDALPPLHDVLVGGLGLTLNQSRKETVALQGETAAAWLGGGVRDGWCGWLWVVVGGAWGCVGWVGGMGGRRAGWLAVAGLMVVGWWWCWCCVGMAGCGTARCVCALKVPSPDFQSPGSDAYLPLRPHVPRRWACCGCAGSGTTTASPVAT